MPAIAHAQPFLENRQVPGSVLVVDDEPVVRQFLSRCIAGWGYSVIEAGSAAEALETMMTTTVSVVLCDIKMPGNDGLWLMERLHAHWPHTPIIMATALDDVATFEQSRERGAFDYLTKPFQPEQLLQAIRRATASDIEVAVMPDEAPAADPPSAPVPSGKIDAEYALECPVRCSACGERIDTVKAVRLLRSHVNFTSTLPRRGRIIVCPHCLAVIPAELTNF